MVGGHMEELSLGAAVGQGAVAPKIVDPRTYFHLRQGVGTVITATKIVTTVTSGDRQQSLHKDLGCRLRLIPMERLYSLPPGSD